MLKISLSGGKKWYHMEIKIYIKEWRVLEITTWVNIYIFFLIMVWSSLIQNASKSKTFWVDT
jgi:hypothetical protein